MRILIACLILSSMAFCRYGDEDPETNHFLLPDKDIHLTNGFYFEGNAIHNTCVGTKLIDNMWDVSTRCTVLNEREKDATSFMPNNLRITLKMQEDFKKLSGDMRVYVTHYDGMAYDFWQEINGVTEIGSTLLAPVLRLSPKNAGTVSAELDPNYLIQMTDFSLEQADYSMNGKMHLLLTKVGEDERVDMEYAVFLRKVY